MPRDDDIISEFERHAGDDEWLREGEELYEGIWDQLVEDFSDDSRYILDQHAADLLFEGWFDPETNSLDRAEIWFDFFDYTGLAWEDFDWEAWREWYEG